MESIRRTERWGVFELHVHASAAEIKRDEIKAVFSNGEREMEVFPFIGDHGEGCCRFMPEQEGRWTFEIVGGSVPESERRGVLLCIPPTPGNRGPVKVAGEKDFAYSDGTPFIPFGTTCLHGVEDESKLSTLEALKHSPFNKVRIAVTYGFTSFSQLEETIVQLGELGMETELILNCGHGDEEGAAFLKLAVDRLSAYQSVWWSLVLNESGSSNASAREKLVRLVRQRDPYGRLLTVHSASPLSNYADAEVTHVSLQYEDVSQTAHFAGIHSKPVLLDACGCEGDAPSLSGSLPAEEMVGRIWNAVCRGGYAGHGEMLVRADGTCWYENGGDLAGAAPARIAFLRAILEEAPAGLRYLPVYYDAPTIGLEGEYYLQYHGIHRFSSKQLRVPEGRYQVELIDAWEMTITTLEEAGGTEVFVKLPVLTHQALRIRRLDGVNSISAEKSYGQESAADIQRLEDENENFISRRERAEAGEGGGPNV